jgi:hypothetical protein
MVSKPIERRQNRVPWLLVLAAGFLAAGPGRLTAADSEVPDLRNRKATQRAVSTAAVSSVEWTGSDFAAIGLMVLGAAVVFIPLPKLRSRKSASIPATPETLEPAATRPATEAGRAETPRGPLDAAQSLVNPGIGPTPVSS